MKTFVCKQCNIEKNISEFYKDGSTKRGHRLVCKKCVLENASKYYNDNKDHVRKYKKQHREQNREKINQQKKEYYYKKSRRNPCYSE